MKGLAYFETRLDEGQQAYVTQFVNTQTVIKEKLGSLAPPAPSEVPLVSQSDSAPLLNSAPSTPVKKKPIVKTSLTDANREKYITGDIQNEKEFILYVLYALELTNKSERDHIADLIGLITQEKDLGNISMIDILRALRTIQMSVSRIYVIPDYNRLYLDAKMFTPRFVCDIYYLLTQMYPDLLNAFNDSPDGDADISFSSASAQHGDDSFSAASDTSFYTPSHASTDTSLIITPADSVNSFFNEDRVRLLQKIAQHDSHAWVTTMAKDFSILLRGLPTVTPHSSPARRVPAHKEAPPRQLRQRLFTDDQQPPPGPRVALIGDGDYSPGSTDDEFEDPDLNTLPPNVKKDIIIDNTTFQYFLAGEVLSDKQKKALTQLDTHLNDIEAQYTVSATDNTTPTSAVPTAPVPSIAQPKIVEEVKATRQATIQLLQQYEVATKAMSNPSSQYEWASFATHINTYQEKIYANKTLGQKVLRPGRVLIGMLAGAVVGLVLGLVISASVGFMDMGFGTIICALKGAEIGGILGLAGGAAAGAIAGVVTAKHVNDSTFEGAAYHLASTLAPNPQIKATTLAHSP